MNKVMVRLIISGRVQGVFFRHSMREVANSYGVSGWVKNRWDGKVEAVLEGNKDSVDKLIEWSREGPPHASVEDVQIMWGEYKGEFRGFSIK